jgi:hypothetical protein
MNTETHTEQGGSGQNQDLVLLRAAIRLNTRLLATTFALIFGLALLFITYASLYRGLPDTGQYLNLLGVFLPGYEVSHTGAWIGMAWGMLIGASLAVLFYRVYALGMEAQVQKLSESSTEVGQPTDATFFIDGKFLGVAAGTVIAAGLIVTTNWLVFRGTADESVHAMLLVNYLPGYSISFIGSIIGAVELFVVVFVLSLIFSGIYNRLATAQPGNTK